MFFKNIYYQMVMRFFFYIKNVCRLYFSSFVNKIEIVQKTPPNSPAAEPKMRLPRPSGARNWLGRASIATKTKKTPTRRRRRA